MHPVPLGVTLVSGFGTIAKDFRGSLYPTDFAILGASKPIDGSDLDAMEPDDLAAFAQSCICRLRHDL